MLISKTTFAQLFYKGGLSAAYSMQKNWNDNQASFITLQSGWLVDYHKDKEQSHTFHHLNTEISYIYYPDSIWKTNTDYLKLNLQWNKKKNNKWESNTAVYFATRYLNKYNNNIANKYWQEGFLNPMELSFSYGWKRGLFKRSTINISLSTIRLVVTPASRVSTKNETTIQLKNNTAITGQYGFQAQSFINEMFYNERLHWINDSRIYINQISEKGILLDMHNIIAIKIYKCLEIRIDTKVQYDYLMSTKIRFKQEALLGFYFSNNKSKASNN
ncbi:MAG: hypothetical protein ORN56_10760 [Chitinophagales bacterium]|nr:hypothetical protein [Chitinophagales bacterium]